MTESDTYPNVPPEFAELARAWTRPEVRWGRAFATAGVILAIGAAIGTAIGYWAGRADGLARR